MFQKYLAYVQDNPHGYWFKNKLYGWGWTPVTWQGWLVVGIYVIALIVFSFTVDENSPPQELAFTFFLPLLLLTTTLIGICLKKGEKPQWRWGIPKEEDRKNNR